MPSRSIIPEGKNLIGPKVRAIRRAMRPKVTLDDVSGRLAAMGLTIDRTILGRIERQERAVIDYEIIALAKALRVRPITLLEP